MNYILRIILILMLACPAAIGSPGQDVRTIAKNVDNRYNHIRTLQAEFTEVYRGAGMERTESGTLWLKKPGKMRWEYRSPKEKLFVSDGKTAWFYLPGDRQVRKAPVSKLNDLRSPLRLLLGKTRLEKELQGLSLASDVTPLTSGNLMLRGIPKGMADRASQVLLEITPESQIARIVIEEVDGSVTEYRFDQQQENVEASDQQFRFNPPPGVEMVEDNFGQ